MLFDTLPRVFDIGKVRQIIMAKKASSPFSDKPTRYTVLADMEQNTSWISAYFAYILRYVLL